MPVGLYLRLSDDTYGTGLAVTRQEQDCRKLAELRGWDVAGVYCDNDFSAFKPNVIRPEFERLLGDLAAGVTDGVVAYDLDRFARQPVDLERAIKLFDARPLTFATVQGDLDLSSGDGRTMARVMVAFANKSSMDTSRRVARKHLELAMQGVPVGGYRPFGYEKDKRTINAKEAELIRTAAELTLSGVGLHTIVRDWNAQGIKTTAGYPFKPFRLKHILTNPRIAGYRVYQGKIALNDGVPVKGQYEPILEVALWEQVCAVLSDPRRSGKHAHIGGRKYLLSGIVRCAVCSQTLRGNANSRWPGLFSYACKSPTAGGCGKVSISGTKLDAMIEALVLAYLSDRETQVDAEPWNREGELTNITNRVQELMKAYTDGTVSGDVVFPAVSRLEDQFNDLKSERASWVREQVALTSRPTNVHEAWPGMETAQRRAVIESVLRAIAVKPSSGRGGKFQPERVSLVWR